MPTKQRLDSIVEKWDLLKHPFYQAWSAGTLPVEEATSMPAPLRVKQPTVYPRRASSSVIAAPMPRLAPVTAMTPRSPAISAVLERGLALRHECGRPFGRVLGLERKRGEIGLDLQSFMNWRVMRAHHRLAREP